MNTWGWPQFVIPGLMILGMGIMLAKDGSPRTGKHCFLTSAVIAGFYAWLLYMGGFWMPCR